MYEDLNSHLLTSTQLAEESTALTVCPFGQKIVVWYESVDYYRSNFYLNPRAVMKVIESVFKYIYSFTIIFLNRSNFSPQNLKQNFLVPEH